MREKIKLILIYFFYGISIGCTFFVIRCLSFALFGGADILEMIFGDFTRQAFGAMLVGVACGGTAVVYRFERPLFLFKVIIHFAVGMGVFYTAAVNLGWIPYDPDEKLLTVLRFLFSCGIFFVIWSCFYLFNRNEAKRINKKLKELERENYR